MKMAESVFADDGRRLGQIVQDGETGRVCFRPAEGMQSPPRRSWQNVDQLKAALRQLYGDVRGRS